MIAGKFCLLSVQSLLKFVFLNAFVNHMNAKIVPRLDL